MIGKIIHVGLTVSNIDKSIEFYKETLGMTLKGELLMEGKETDILFGRPNSKARIAYLVGNEDINSVPIELIQFIDNDIKKTESSLFKTSISEVCFEVKDIELVYQRLLASNVECISSPQYYDFTDQGFGKSKAIYFRDPDGIILEVMELL